MSVLFSHHLEGEITGCIYNAEMDAMIKEMRDEERAGFLDKLSTPTVRAVWKEGDHRPRPKTMCLVKGEIVKKRPSFHETLMEIARESKMQRLGKLESAIKSRMATLEDIQEAYELRFMT